MPKWKLYSTKEPIIESTAGERQLYAGYILRFAKLSHRELVEQKILQHSRLKGGYHHDLDTALCMYTSNGYIQLRSDVTLADIRWTKVSVDMAKSDYWDNARTNTL